MFPFLIETCCGPEYCGGHNMQKSLCTIKFVLFAITFLLLRLIKQRKKRGKVEIVKSTDAIDIGSFIDQQVCSKGCKISDSDDIIYPRK